MTAAPTVNNIVDQFRLALEACEHAHAQTSEATPYIAPRTTRVSFSEPLTVPAGCISTSPPADKSFIPITSFPGHAQVATKAPTVVGIDPQVAAANATIPATSVATPSRSSSTGRLLLYIILAGVIAAVAIFVRRRYLSPMWNALAAGTLTVGNETTSEEESVSRIVANQQRKKRSRTKENNIAQPPNDGIALSEMSTYLRKPTASDTTPSATAGRELAVHTQKRDASIDEPVKSARSAPAKVDLRKVRFEKEEEPAPSQEDVPRAAFFEVDEDDPNFVPL